MSYFFIVRVSPPAVGNDPSFEISSSKIVMKIVQSLIEISLVLSTGHGQQDFYT